MGTKNVQAGAAEVPTPTLSARSVLPSGYCPQGFLVELPLVDISAS